MRKNLRSGVMFQPRCSLAWEAAISMRPCCSGSSREPLFLSSHEPSAILAASTGISISPPYCTRVPPCRCRCICGLGRSDRQADRYECRVGVGCLGKEDEIFRGNPLPVTLGQWLSPCMEESLPLDLSRAVSTSLAASGMETCASEPGPVTGGSDAGFCGRSNVRLLLCEAAGGSVRYARRPDCTPRPEKGPRSPSQLLSFVAHQYQRSLCSDRSSVPKRQRRTAD